MANSERIYLDYAAATPVDPAVLRAMQPYFSEKFGNAGSLHSFGQEAIAALDAARETIARSIGSDFHEIIFTSSATEANNLALRGVVGKWASLKKKEQKPRIIISSIEHESVLETARGLEQNGTEVVYLPVDRSGVVDLKRLETNLSENTVLVSVMYANNEIGTVQPIREVANVIKKFKKAKKETNYPLFHTDAAQAFQFLGCGVSELGVDLMTLSSHKIYGPKGAGVLSGPTSLVSPTFTGGGQEFDMRSGTENIPAIVGFANAAEKAVLVRDATSKNISKLRDELWFGIKKVYPKAQINGVLPPTPHINSQLLYLPNILNVYFPGRKAQDLLTKLDLLGLAVSSGSACRARASRTSYVIKAIGHSSERARASVRFSLGRPTTKNEIAQALTAIKKTIRSVK